MHESAEPTTSLSPSTASSSTTQHAGLRADGGAGLFLSTKNQSGAGGGHCCMMVPLYSELAARASVPALVLVTSVAPALGRRGQCDDALRSPALKESHELMKDRQLERGSRTPAVDATSMVCQASASGTFLAAGDGWARGHEENHAQASSVR